MSNINKVERNLDDLLELFTVARKAKFLLSQIKMRHSAKPDKMMIYKIITKDIEKFLSNRYAGENDENDGFDGIIRQIEYAKEAVHLLWLFWTATSVYELPMFLPDKLAYEIRDFFEFDDSE